jgi:hypothetical protein
LTTIADATVEKRGAQTGKAGKLLDRFVHLQRQFTRGHKDISARVPFSGLSRMVSNGRANAAVLPVPRLSAANDVAPLHNNGMLRAWIGVGRSYPSAANSFADTVESRIQQRAGKYGLVSQEEFLH